MFKARHRFFLLTAVSFCLLTHCATIVTGNTQTVNVRAINVVTGKAIPGTRCTITDGKGRVYTLDSNPGSVVLRNGQGRLRIDCFKRGFQQKHVVAGRNLNNWIFANGYFWPGLILDAASGAALKYPPYLTVVLEPLDDDPATFIK